MQEKSGLSLRPTTVLIFGSPKIGTIIMLKNQSSALDLPMKILIYESESKEVIVLFRDINILKKQFEIVGLDELFSIIATTLNELTQPCCQALVK